MTDPEGADSSHWYTDRKFTISITAFLLILPLSIPKEIGFQKYARWVGRAGLGLMYERTQREQEPGVLDLEPMTSTFSSALRGSDLMSRALTWNWGEQGSIPSFASNFCDLGLIPSHLPYFPHL